MLAAGGLHELQSAIHTINPKFFELLGSRAFNELGLATIPGQKMVTIPTDMHKSFQVVRYLYDSCVQELARQHVVDAPHGLHCAQCFEDVQELKKFAAKRKELRDAAVVAVRDGGDHEAATEELKQAAAGFQKVKLASRAAALKLRKRLLQQQRENPDALPDPTSTFGAFCALLLHPDEDGSSFENADVKLTYQVLKRGCCFTAKKLITYGHTSEDPTVANLCDFLFVEAAATIAFKWSMQHGREDVGLAARRILNGIKFATNKSTYAKVLTAEEYLRLLETSSAQALRSVAWSTKGCSEDEVGEQIIGMLMKFMGSSDKNAYWEAMCKRANCHVATRDAVHSIIGVTPKRRNPRIELPRLGTIIRERIFLRQHELLKAVPWRERQNSSGHRILVSMKQLREVGHAQMRLMSTKVHFKGIAGAMATLKDFADWDVTQEQASRKMMSKTKMGRTCAASMGDVKTGKRVELHNLETTSLNGAVGVCGAAIIATDRFNITIEGGRTIAIKPENLRPTPPPVPRTNWHIQPRTEPTLLLTYIDTTPPSPPIRATPKRRRAHSSSSSTVPSPTTPAPGPTRVMLKPRKRTQSANGKQHTAKRRRITLTWPASSSSSTS
jgi:hypothetical protein